MATRTMPFGRYKGTLFTELPDAYLLWLSTLDNIRDPLRGCILEERDRRAQAQTQAPPVPVDPALVERLIATGFKRLAMELHPDRGGTTRAMQDLVAARDWLQVTIEELLLAVRR